MSDYQSYPQTTQWTAPSQTNTLAIVSLVAGIATWMLLPVIGAIVAVITGHIANKQIRASGGQQTGKGMAIAGLVLGYLQAIPVVLVILAVCVIFVLALLGPLIGGIFSDITTSI